MSNIIKRINLIKSILLILFFNLQTFVQSQNKLIKQNQIIQQNLNYYTDTVQIFLHDFYSEYIASLDMHYRYHGLTQEASKKINALKKQYLTKNFLATGKPTFTDGLAHGRHLYGGEANYKGVMITTDWHLNMLDIQRILKDEIYRVCYDYDDFSGYTIFCLKVSVAKQKSNYLIDDVEVLTPMRIEDYQIANVEINRNNSIRAKLQQINPITTGEQYLSQYQNDEQIFLHKFYTEYVKIWSNYRNIQQLLELRRENLTQDLLERIDNERLRELKQLKLSPKEFEHLKNSHWSRKDPIINNPYKQVYDEMDTAAIWMDNLEVQIMPKFKDKNLYKVCGSYYTDDSYNVHCLQINLIKPNNKYLINDIKPLPLNTIYFDQIEQIKASKMHNNKNKRLNR